MSKHFKYHDKWRTEILVCSRCGWRGTFEEGAVEWYEALMDSSCPRCDYESAPILAIVNYPTAAESRANWSKLDDEEKKALRNREKHLRDFEKRCLKRPKQLPDISSTAIRLLWDFRRARGQADTVIRHGKRILWREPACYEGYRRFADVVEILRKKYGSRLIDLEPTQASELYLYGDKLSAPELVETIRRELRENTGKKSSSR